MVKEKNMKKNQSNIKVSMGERIFYFLNYVFFIICAAITIFPLLYLLSMSLSSSNAINSGKVFLLPVETTLAAYKNIVEDGQILYAFKNTIVITVAGTVLNMISTILCAYPLSRKRLKGRGIFSGLIVFTMMFSGGMIPNFLLVKSLGLMDTHWALWLPGLISVYNMIVLRSFFQGIPDSLEEAAQVDGANDIYILIRIILPLSGPVLATLVLFYAVGWWNEYFNAMIYLNSSSLQPMQLKLMQLLQNINQELLSNTSGSAGALEQDKQDLVSESVRAASTVITVLPILCVYPFLQKYFVKGVMVGSVKG